MRSYVFILFSITVFFSIITIVHAANTYSESQIKNNAKMYINTVFGNQAPTLKDYGNYEGYKDPSETELEEKVCIKKWGGVNHPKCDQWIKHRYNRVDKEKSLYYEEIRKLVKIKPKNVRIKGIKRGNAKGKANIITVVDKKSGIILTLYHAYNTSYADIGLIGLWHVNDKKINKLLALE